MPTLNGHPYHLTTATIHPLYNEPSAFQAITAPSTPPLVEERMPSSAARERGAMGTATTTSATAPATTTSTAAPTVRTRHNARHIPRIPRLRRPIVLDESQNSLERNETTSLVPTASAVPPIPPPHTYNLQHMSISSAISTTTTGRRLQSPQSTQDQCLEPVDLSSLFAATHDYSFMTKQKEENYSYLDFQLIPHKTNTSSSSFDVEDFISYQHGALYRYSIPTNICSTPQPPLQKKTRYYVRF
ncbi:hypothetical protein BCR42DRAFT_414905, partial [Absidia repens]